MRKIGINNFRFKGAPWKDQLALSQKVEQLGFNSISMGESWGEDSLTSLAQIAAVTSKIKIGTSIVPTYGRTPANLAMTALNMDKMSEGRFFLGLGASGKAVIEGFHGEKFEKPLSRMREYINIIRLAMNNEKLDNDGEFFKTSRFRLQFESFRNNIPIYIASLSPASLRMTGEIADGWLPIYLVPTNMEHSLNLIKEGAKTKNRQLSDIKLSPQVSIYLTDNHKEAFDRERPHIAFYIGGMGIFYHEYMHRIGFGSESDKIREAYLNRDRDKAAELVTDEMVAAMTIIGTQNECSDQMDIFFNAGIDEVRLVFNEPDFESYVKSIESVSELIQ